MQLEVSDLLVSYSIKVCRAFWLMQVVVVIATFAKTRNKESLAHVRELLYCSGMLYSAHSTHIQTQEYAVSHLTSTHPNDTNHPTRTPSIILSLCPPPFVDVTVLMLIVSLIPSVYYCQAYLQDGHSPSMVPVLTKWIP
jgi:hypothetical protein